MINNWKENTADVDKTHIIETIKQTGKAKASIKQQVKPYKDRQTHTGNRELVTTYTHRARSNLQFKAQY